MVDDKPKHKPQKKRTLEEVLKSLQDLIRSDLVSARVASGTPANASDRMSAAPAAADEPDNFQDALHKLDEIITEKIIEPVERARETPPEPLLPDEELEIVWSEPAEPVEPLAPLETEEIADLGEVLTDEIVIEGVDSVTWETASTSPQEEIEAEPPAELPPAAEPPAESPEQAPPEQPPSLEIDETVVLEAIDEQATESAAAAPAESPQAEPAEPSVLEPPQEAAESNGQSMFDFELPPLADAAASPAPEPQLEAAPPTSTQPPPLAVEPEKPIAQESEVNRAARAETHERETLPDSPHDRENEPEEQSGAATVEFEKRAVDDFTVEFTVESIKPAPPDSSAPQSEQVTAAPSADESQTDAASHLTEQSSVSKNSDTPPSTRRTSPERPGQPESPAAPSGTESTAGSTSASEGIPILKEVADLDTPPSPPLPDASQARDIAIRVIARLNIERRKTGETPLDIKTIDRLQQYLADALSKRALNKPK